MAEAAAAAFSWVVQQGTKALMAVGFSKGTATAIASFATKAAVTTALSVAATAILAPRVGAEGGALALNDNLDAGIPYVAGRRAVAGVLQHADEFGADERYMGFINVKSGAGPVDAIESNRADSVAVTTDANGMVTSPEVFAGKMWLRDQLGQQPEIAHLTQPGLYQGAMMAGWSSTEKLSGKAAHILTLQQDSKFKSYPAGVPVFESTVRGIKWYDPRLDSTYPGGSGSCRFDDQATWVYSTNGAIHALGYALGLRENGQVVEGFGCPITDIVLEDYVEAANVADMNGWHCNAYWTSKDRPWQVYTAFLQAAGAVHVTKWGKLGCMPRGAARVSLTTISAADTAAAVSIQPLASRRDRINTITPKCPLESHQWAEPDLTPVKIQHYIDNEDGGEVRDRGVHYPFVTNEGNPQQAAQLAAYDILDSREGMTGVIPVRPYLMDLDPGDCFTVTEPGFNLAAQKFLVQKRSFDFETGVSILHLISETDGKHALALGQSSDAPDAPSLVAPDLTSVPAPGVSVWTAVAGTGDQPNLIVTGATDNATATHVRLEYRLTTPSGGGSWPDDDTGWSIYDDFPIETESITVTGLEPDTGYQVAISYISAFGVPGDRRIIATLTTGAINAGAVGGLSREQFEALVEAVQAQVDAGRDAIDAEAADFAAAMQTLRDSFAAGHETVDDAVQARLGLIDSTTGTLTSDIRTQARDTREALAVAGRSALAVLAQVEENRTLAERVGNFSASFSEQVKVLITDVGSLSTQVGAWTAVNVSGDIASALTTEITARVEGDEALGERVDAVEVTAGDAQSKAKEILALTVSPTSAIALKFSGIEQSVGTLQTNYTNIINLENIGGSSLLQRFENIEAQQDPATPGGLRARIDDAAEIQIADNAARTREIRETQASVARAALTIFAAQETFLTENEAALQLIEQANLAIGANTAGFQSIIDMTLDPASGLSQRFETIEVQLDVGTENSIAARVGGLEQARITENAATVRELRELWAANARSNVAFFAQVEAVASENESTLTIIEQARLETASVDLRVDSILDLSIVDGTALGTRLESIEAATQGNAAAITDAAQVQAGDHAAALRLLREAEALTARAALIARAMVDASASSDEAIITELNQFKVSTADSLAQLDMTKITSADLDQAFAAFSLNLSAAFDIPQEFADIAADLDPNLVGSFAYLAQNAMTAAATDQAIANYQFTVGSQTLSGSAALTQHAVALATLQGGSSVVYSIELDANGHVSGLYATNDGTQSSFVFAVDNLAIGSGANTVAPFRFDTQSGEFVAQNIRVGSAVIEDASIDQIKLKSGSVGQWVSASLPSHDLCPGTPSDPKLEADFAGVTLVTPELMIRDNDLLVATHDYYIDAEYDCLQWFYWRTRMQIFYKSVTGAWILGRQWPWRITHIGRSSASHSSDAGFFTPSTPFSGTEEAIVPPGNPGGNWVHHTLEETPAYLEFQLEPYGPGSDTQCRFGGPRPSQIATTLKATSLSLRLMKLSSGGFITS